MAFSTNLVAVSWQKDRYTVVSQISADIDTVRLDTDGLLHNVSDYPGYIDEAAILHKKQLPQYLLTETNSNHQKVMNWYASLPSETMFILVHRLEWETGMGSD